MHAPSTSEAYHLMTEDHFRLMKPEAIFINTSRGATVDEPALIKALQEAGSLPLVWMCLNRSCPIRPIRAAYGQRHSRPHVASSLSPHGSRAPPSRRSGDCPGADGPLAQKLRQSVRAGKDRECGGSPTPWAGSGA